MNGFLFRRGVFFKELGERAKIRWVRNIGYRMLDFVYNRSIV